MLRLLLRHAHADSDAGRVPAEGVTSMDAGSPLLRTGTAVGDHAASQAVTCPWAAPMVPGQHSQARDPTPQVGTGVC